MEFIDLKTQYRVLKDAIDTAVQNVLTEGNYILGEDVSALEKELADYVGAKHCITCANGTDALTLALRALKIGKGDAVFVPSFTFFASAETIVLEGATPLFVDVSTDTFNIDPEKLSEEIKIAKKEGKLNLKAIMTVDLFGLCADYTKIRAIAKEFELKIIEDGAQGFGGSIGTKRACGFGDISTTSFFPAKPLGCYGDGGAIFTDNDSYKDELLSLRFHGKGADKYDNVRIGYNSRLDTLQAAILRVKLDAFKTYELEKRNAVADRYNAALKDIVTVPVIPSNYVSSYAQYTLKNENRNELQKFLRGKGIPSMVYYPKGMHQQTALLKYAANNKRLSSTEYLAKTVLSIPMHPYLEDEAQDLIIGAIKEYYGR